MDGKDTYLKPELVATPPGCLYRNGRWESRSEFRGSVPQLGQQPGGEEERTGGVDPLAVAEQLVRGMRNYQKGARAEAIEALRELADHIKTGGSASPSLYRTKIPEDILELIKPG
ncbi:MAG: hypothetical protein H6556_23085 [Lewinellaceae bacterium]|nr:hypothetical protein [Lewinellaceae bacterium]